MLTNIYQKIFIFPTYLIPMYEISYLFLPHGVLSLISDSDLVLDAAP